MNTQAGLDPRFTCEVTLPQDNRPEVPEAQRRKLICRYMSAREWIEFNSRYQKAMAALNDGAVFINCMVDAMSMIIVGFSSNFTGPSSLKVIAWNGPESLLDALSPADLQDLCMNISTDLHLTELDRKKSARQSPGTAANSEPAAANTAGGSV